MTPSRAGTTAVVAVLAAAGLLLVLVTWAASIGPDRVLSGGRVEPAEPLPTVSSTAADEEPDPVEEERRKERGDPPAWVRVLAVALELVLLAAVGLGLFLFGRKVWDSLQRRWFRRRRHVAPEHVEFEVLGTAERVSGAIGADAAEQRAKLFEGGSPRNAIVACWHRFELQAVRAGVGQRPWQTTGEFVLDVLDEVGADRGAVGRLADLYREARFSDHAMTEEHRSAALAALDEIHLSLRGGVGAR